MAAGLAPITPEPGNIVDYSLLLKAVLLGIVEGLTEFLPISSTGHLILASHWLEFNRPEAKTFEVVIQLGAILSVCWHFRDKLIDVLIKLPSEAGARRFAFRLLAGFMPAAVLGLALHGFIKHTLFNPVVVACSLLAGGIAILLIERLAPTARVHEIDDIDLWTAFRIGLAQSLALIPGVSRSGATIMGSLLLGVARPCATEFSFFLAIPVMFAATVFDVYKSRDDLHPDFLPVFAVGFVFAFLSALATIRFLLRYVAHHDFSRFAWYRIVVGTVVLAMSGHLVL